MLLRPQKRLPFIYRQQTIRRQSALIMIFVRFLCTICANITLISIDFILVIGKINQIWRCSGPIPIANKIGSINLVHATQLAPILITITLGTSTKRNFNNKDFLIKFYIFSIYSWSHPGDR